MRPFRRIAIVNRGDPAMRLIRAVRDAAGANRAACATIALYTDPDEHALFVREADEAVCLGPAMSADPAGKRRSGYFDYARLEAALKEANADAAWVGWGFIAEDPRFAELCERLGIVFIGPPAAAMRALGDKISAKRLAEAVDVPVGAWSGGPVDDFDAALQHARRIGFPLVVKASAGGGGRGVRLVGSEAELGAALETARAEAEVAFGDSSVFLEQFVPAARHVEVQVVCDGFGTAWALGVRECSVQRRFQKIVEESASCAVSDKCDAELGAAAVRLCLAAGYRGVATVEFLLDAATGAPAFMEVNARLQVEHGVTEMVTGADLVRLQLDVAAGSRLEGDPPIARGHAMEARLCAEDPWNGFAPASGRIETLRLPGGPGIRVDTGVAEGDDMPPEFDSMIAKVIAWGEDRPQALARLVRAVEETEVVIRSGASNRAFLLRLLQHDDMRRDAVDVTWLERTDFSVEGGEHATRVALIAAAVEAYGDDARVDRDHFYASAARGRPELPRSAGKSIELRHDGTAYRFTVYRQASSTYRLAIDGCDIEVAVEAMNRYDRRVLAGGRWHRVRLVPQAADFSLEVDGAPCRVARSDGSVVRAPSPAIVTAILVQPGQQVTAGTAVALLEAMKTITEVTSPVDGVVARILAGPNVQVEASAPLLEIEASAATESRPGNRVSFDLLAGGEPTSAAEEWLQRLGRLRQAVLGFDVDETEFDRFAAAIGGVCRRAGEPASDIRRVENEILDVFTDICALSQGKRELLDEAGDEAHGQREHLLTYLRSIDTEARGLPAGFRTNLRKALAHYGVHTLKRDTELEESVVEIFRAQREVDRAVPAVIAILERLNESRACDGIEEQALEPLLDGMVAVTQGRFPSVADIAHELRFRRFQQPVFELGRARVYAAMEAHLDELEARPDAAGREAVIEELVSCAQPLQNLLTQRAQQASDERKYLMLEVLTRRYYRTHELHGFTPFTCAGRVFGEAAYIDGDGSHRVFSGFGSPSSLAGMATCLKPALCEAVPRGADAFVDFYLWSEAGLDEDDAAERVTRAVLNAAQLPACATRLLVAISAPGLGLGMSSTQHFTYVRDGSGHFVEDRVSRGLHPMMAERLQLWRLRNFKTDRLPSVEDVYLFHGVAFDNPKDERLFAFAEVRDLEPIRDELGRIQRLPVLERMYMEALAAIRREQARRPPGARLLGNRVTLYVWPSAPFGMDGLQPVIERLSAASSGLGMEKTVVHVRLPDALTGEAKPTILHFSTTPAAVSVVRFETPTDQPIQPLSDYRQKVVHLARRGLVYPYELIATLAPATDGDPSGLPRGEFVEHDLEGDRLVPVTRAPGRNTANVVVGIVSNFTDKYPEGVRRVIVLGDPSRSLGALAEPECRRIIAALDLAERMQAPLEWFAVSSGARISMDSGTENMDWIAAVLRRLVEFTQAGGEVNVVVNGINVGAQPYWNAEATMLMHTRGILVMTPDGAMVLTGKQALDYSGGVSADDNYGIGGYEHVMGPNGQAQYWAADLAAACRLLLRHYELTYRAPGERFPRSLATSDPRDRDVTEAVGDVFSAERNPERKNPFDIRSVMTATVDRDHAPLERWLGMRDAETTVVWDAYLGGRPVCVIGIESKPVIRRGVVPADGPQQWTAGTLFPLSSKKVARALNSASGNRPVVVLANLSGFDGSPESMRSLQLEYGAEIGRAVVNFKGPIVFCVVSRYHGGAFVVFSTKLNPALEIAAVEGSYASVIGGAPAAGVVFSGEVEKRTRSDPRIIQLEESIAAAGAPEKGALRARLTVLMPEVRSEKLGEVAAEFDAVHNVHRAQRVGSIHRIIAATTLRPYLIDAVERGMRRELPEAAVAGAGDV